ncbi:DNA mismatch repair protein MutS [Fusibacter tunisiensis]|uniref:DNA mismatch repair protein MutS n=1 Tax=Fusibacter tunisiensis TaxID=1008308 RepID=A0ABS2MTI4_9FIRM|nr:DNA mismatch repair protein MutS [Fusibacter tunisiensis]MBM7562577.1 DNA mismatch repair protein MutS [Fusibacter tunisiensis]
MTIDRSKLTPMMKQYFEIKDQYMEYILMYRLGDFYEMFFEDAIKASQALEITLTARNCGLEDKAPLCGVPHHSVDGYIKRLVDQGIKVAICEQMEDPALAKGIVKREVVRIITPGTITDPDMLDASNNNYIASVSFDENGFGLAYCDITTGVFKATEMSQRTTLLDEIIKIEPSEVIVPEGRVLDDTIRSYLNSADITVTEYLAYAFETHASRHVIQRLFDVFSTESLGFSEYPIALNACGGLLAYVEETAKVPLAHITEIDLYTQGHFMMLDKFTRRNLELVETMRSKEKKGSLLWVVDKTSTAMGARKLKTWMEEPLLDKGQIDRRLETVEVLVEDLMLRSDLRTLLKQVYDLERLVSKLVYGSMNPRDMIALKNSLMVLPDVKACIQGQIEGEFETIHTEIYPLEDVRTLIESAIVEDPPFTMKDGGFIQNGFNADLDELRDIVKNGKKWLLEVEQREREMTGIKNLKIGFNKVFGYYLEISKGSVKDAPDTYIRKQTLANAERYITPELKTLEEKILGAEEKINRLEQELFSNLKSQVMASITPIRKTAGAVASLDALLAFSECSYRYGYVKPKITTRDDIRIKNGRHPVIERIFKDSIFVPNDTYLNGKEDQFYIITGPNMAGKSTYLRQVALITLMAQIGCFVPAEKAEIGIVDRIFTRVGASDDLSQGQSTFMVEMSELANILNNATPNSLIILDEIGRGTSTYDGLSIAWSVVEYLAEKSTKTLFATHYHELTELEGLVKGVKNYRIAVKEAKDDILFLRKIEPGGANQSFGVQVAKLAGVPIPVIKRAKEILAKLEVNDINRNIEKMGGSDSARESYSVSSYEIDESLYKYIETVEVDQMTPIEAMNTLYTIVSKFRDL